jgi:glycosyltransferase involved in cell wall biosynthesis
MWEYCYFTGACFVMSLYVAMKHGFDVIHAHNPPDTLFLVAAFYKPFGKKFVFDHHDLCPELYRSRYKAESGFLTTILGLFEKGSLALADVTIATNESYRAIQIERGKVKPENVFIVRNGPNLKRVAYRTPSERLRAINKCILCYIGALNPQDGVDYLLRSLRDLLYKLNRKDFYCVIMGTGDSLEDLRSLAVELNLEGYVELTGYVSEEDLMSNLSAADICVDPDPSSPLNDVSTWIKIMEYMALGKPIVAYDLKETHWSAQDAALYVKPNNELEFAEGIAKLMDRPDLRAQIGEFGRQRIHNDLKWDVVGQNLLRAYEKLLGKPRHELDVHSHVD